MAHTYPQHDRELTHSGWEKKGGYASPKKPVPVASLPKVPTGPAPGAAPASGANNTTNDKK